MTGVAVFIVGLVVVLAAGFIGVSIDSPALLVAGIVVGVVLVGVGIYLGSEETEVDVNRKVAECLASGGTPDRFGRSGEYVDCRRPG